MPTGKKKTTEEFIREAIRVHGQKYDYSLVKYEKSSKKVVIICKKCKEQFNQSPNNHLRGGCYKCSGIMKKTTTQFIEEAKLIHGDKYDYTLVDYKNGRTHVTIICKKCNNIFKQQPSHHLKVKGNSCSKCSGFMKKTTAVFIGEAKLIHGDKYDYTLVDYNNNHKKITIICKKCNNIFKQQASHHLNGHGCPKCAAVGLSLLKAKSPELFIEQADKVHFGLYDYTYTEYTGVNKKINILCKKCNCIFSQNAGNHLQGSGCPKCAVLKRSSAQRKTTETFIEEASAKHPNLYDYTQTKYIKDREKVTILCKRCNRSFEQAAGCHLGGQGCPFHTNKTQLKAYDYIKSLYPSALYEYRFPDLPNRRFDIFIPEENIIIEIDGDQHFTQVKNWYPPEITHKIDKSKMDFLFVNNISVIRLYQPDVLDDTFNWREYLLETIKEKFKGLYTASTKPVYTVFDDYQIPSTIVFADD